MPTLIEKSYIPLIQAPVVGSHLVPGAQCSQPGVRPVSVIHNIMTSKSLQVYNLSLTIATVTAVTFETLATV